MANSQTGRNAAHHRDASLVWVLLSLLATLVLVPHLVLQFMQHTLHFGCAIASVPDAESGAFVCADGSAYLGAVAILLGVLLGVSAVALTLVLRTGSTDSRGTQLVTARTVVALSTLPLVVVGGAARHAGTHSGYWGAHGADYWTEPMLAVTVLYAGIALLIVLTAVLRSGSARLVAVSLAFLGLALAAFMQPGAAAAPVIAACLLAAGLAFWPRSARSFRALRVTAVATEPAAA